MDIGAWRATVYGVAESNLTEQLATFLYAFNFIGFSLDFGLAKISEDFC